MKNKTKPTVIPTKGGKAKRNTKKGSKKKANKKEFTLLTDVKEFMASQRFQRTSGLLVITLAILMTVSFVSYLFTWQHDQSLLMGNLSDMFWDKEVVVDNWLGKIGAIVSHVFFYKGFGVSSFVLPFLLALWGLYLVAKVNPLPPLKTLNVSIFSMVWVSAFLGFFFSGTAILGGLLGFQSKLWLSSFLGNFGGAAVLAFSLLAFVILMFNPSFAWATNWIGRMGAALEEDEAEGEVVPEKNQVRTSDGFDVVEKKVTPVATKVPAATVLTEKQVSAEEEVLNSILSEKVEEDILSVMEQDEQLELTTSFTEEKPVDKGFEVPPAPSEKAVDSDDEEFEVSVAKEEETLTEVEVKDKLKEFGEYDPTLDLSSYEPPTLDLLIDYGGNELSVSKEELEANKNNIVQTLANYKIGIAKIKATIGPTVTLYEIVPEAGVRISKIKNLEDDIALSLAALGIRIIAPIPGKGTIGIEVPNSSPDMVAMRTLIASDKFQNSDMALPVALGKTIANETFVADLAKMPHLLMAGATGQGKSVGLNAILVSLLYKKHPAQIKFVLVDPKKVELTLFNKIERHYLAKLPGDEEAIITDTAKVVTTLNSLCVEMDQRYELLKEAMVRNIKEYNAKFIQRKLNPEKGHRYMPYIILVVDEFADLIMTAGKEVETPIARLAQLARAIGIHLIIATQRPSVNIITGTIKANFPARIAFRVTSKIDSRTILDAGGADQLIGRGDMLFNTGNNLIRLQCGFVDTPEVEAICDFIGNQRAYPEAYLLPEYIDENAKEVGSIDAEDRDVLFEDAARVIVMHQQGSTSLIQRKLKLGYNRAGRIVDQLEAAGIIGQFEGSKARKVLVPDEYSLEQLLNSKAENA